MWRFGQMTFGNFFSAKQRFGKISIQNSQNDVPANYVSGKNDVQLNDDSEKQRSAERRFGKMTFGWTTIRKNVVQHYEVSLIRRFGHVKIRSNDFRPFFFGKTTRQNFNAKLQIAKLQIVKLPLSVTSSLYFNLLLVLKYLPSRDKN